MLRANGTQSLSRVESLPGEPTTGATQAGASSHSRSPKVLTVKLDHWMRSNKQTNKRMAALWLVSWLLMQRPDPSLTRSPLLQRELGPFPYQVVAILHAPIFVRFTRPNRPRSDDKGHIETTNVTGNLDLFLAIIPTPPPPQPPSSPSSFSKVYFSSSFEDELCQYIYIYLSINLYVCIYTHTDIIADFSWKTTFSNHKYVRNTSVNPWIMLRAQYHRQHLSSDFKLT